MKRRTPTFLQSAIPASRGPARHIETDGVAMTQFVGGVVAEVHTPPSPLKRVHEVMHARHTSATEYPEDIVPQVMNLIEDCRLHLLHWPWGERETPSVIRDDILAVLNDEGKVLGKEGTFPFAEFAIRFRAQCVTRPAGIFPLLPAKLRDYASPAVLGSRSRAGVTARAKRELANRLVNAIISGDHVNAAYALQNAFDLAEPEYRAPEDSENGKEGKGRFGKGFPIKRKGKGKGKADSGKEAGGTGEGVGSGRSLVPTGRRVSGGLRGEFKHDGHMETIVLPFVAPTTSEVKGTRLATSGARLYRPALRRPVLPQRIFLRNTPLEPGGTVLFDASGSMGVSAERLAYCCRLSPLATVAYYCGHDDGRNRGWLYIFARDGMRSDETPIPECGNGVDGLALDWLLEQEGPRIFVSDLEFTCSDKSTQIVRVDSLVQDEVLTVFEGYAEFIKEFEKLDPELAARAAVA